VLEAEQEGLGLEAAAEAGQLAVAADDAVARDQDRQWVDGVGLADRPLPLGRRSLARQVCRAGLCASLGLHSAAF